MNHLAARASLKAACMVLACIAGLAHAQKPSGLPGAYPNKPVRIIVGSSPGGGTDIITRLVIAKLGSAALLALPWKQAIGVSSAFSTTPRLVD